MFSRSPIPTCLTLLTWALLAAAAAGAQTTWHVDDDAPNDPGPGDPTISDPLEDGSAEHPFDAIQEGIDAAADGDRDCDGDVFEYVPFDLDGEGRFFDDPDKPDTGSGLPPIVDMGAYEFGGSDPPPCRGDFDADRDVDHNDLVVLLAHYGMTSGATGADGDMDCDGDVELSDLAELLGAYGDTCE